MIKFWERIEHLQKAYENSQDEVFKQIYKMKLLNLMLQLEEHEKKEVNP
jgi:predicted negative regulator of RcsB-dependent stress response